MLNSFIAFMTLLALVLTVGYLAYTALADVKAHENDITTEELN